MLVLPIGHRSWILVAAVAQLPSWLPISRTWLAIVAGGAREKLGHSLQACAEEALAPCE